MTKNVASGLRRLWNLRKVKFSTVTPVAFAGIEQVQQWESLVPGHSHGGEMHEEHLDPESCQQQDKGETGNVPMTDDSSQQCHNNLEGIWEVTKQSASKVCGELRFMIIQANQITTAHMKSYALNREGRPNTVTFGDAVGELAADGTLKMMLANGNVAFYRHFDPPSDSKLRDLQGSWILWHKGKYVRNCALKIEGACVEVLNQGKPSKHYLHVPKPDGSLKLKSHIMDTTLYGSLFLHTTSGQIMQYVRECVRPNMVSLQE